MDTRPSIIERARAYTGRMPRSIQGQGGSAALYEVAQVLVKGFGLSESDASKLLVEWNELHSAPAWSEKDVLRKIKDAARNSRKPVGYLLADATESHRPLAAELERQEKQRKREAWPQFHPLSEPSIRKIAELRGLAPLTVAGVNSLGLLSGAVVDGHRCFVIHESYFAQARRFDGGMFRVGRGDPVKAKNLPGSEGRFIGWKSLGPPENPILLVEGCIGYLEGWNAAMDTGADMRGWSVLAAVCAGSRFTAAELHRLRGRKIRIVPDNDKAGLEAVGIWAAALRTVCCEVRVFQLPEPAKDLGDVMKDGETLTEIFAAYA